MSSLDSINGNSGSNNLYQLMMQGLQSTSVSSSINTASSLSASLTAIDQILFSGASVSSATSLTGTSAANSLEPLQQFLSQTYKA